MNGSWWDQPGTAVRADAVVGTFKRGVKYATSAVNMTITAPGEVVTSTTLRSRRDKVSRYLREGLGVDLVCGRTNGKAWWLIGPTASQAAVFNNRDSRRHYSEDKAKYLALLATHPKSVQDQARLSDAANERLKALIHNADRRGISVVQVMIDVGVATPPPPAPTPPVVAPPQPATTTNVSPPTP